jgi:DNA-binding protein H-NS
MAKTYEQVMRQIDGLKAEAEKLRRKEVDGVIARIREAVKHYGISAEDLGLSRAPKAAASRGPKVRRKAKTPAVVKFRNDSGGTWGGRGKRPQWLRDALLAGKTLDDFKV